MTSPLFFTTPSFFTSQSNPTDSPDESAITTDNLDEGSASSTSIFNTMNLGDYPVLFFTSPSNPTITTDTSDEATVTTDKPGDPTITADNPDEPIVSTNKPDEDTVTTDKPDQDTIATDSPDECSEPSKSVEAKKIGDRTMWLFTYHSKPTIITEKTYEATVITDSPDERSAPSPFISNVKKLGVFTPHSKPAISAIDKPDEPIVAADEPDQSTPTDKSNEPIHTTDKPDESSIPMDKPDEPTLTTDPEEPTVTTNSANEHSAPSGFTVKIKKFRKHSRLFFTRHSKRTVTTDNPEKRPVPSVMRKKPRNRSKLSLVKKKSQPNDRSHDMYTVATEELENTLHQLSDYTRYPAECLPRRRDTALASKGSFKKSLPSRSSSLASFYTAPSHLEIVVDGSSREREEWVAWPWPFFSVSSFLSRFS